jgi:hypothetical protein
MITLPVRSPACWLQFVEGRQKRLDVTTDKACPELSRAIRFGKLVLTHTYLEAVLSSLGANIDKDSKQSTSAIHHQLSISQGPDFTRDSAESN